MSYIPPEPPHVPRFPPFRIPVGAIVLLVTIAALFPGMVLLLGSLTLLFVYLGALGSTVGQALAGAAGIVFVLMVWKAPPRWSGSVSPGHAFRGSCCWARPPWA